MKSSKKSTIKKKYQTAGMVTPALPKSGPELTYPADVYYGQENVTGAFPTGESLDNLIPFTRSSQGKMYSNPSEMFKTPAPFGNYTTANQPQGTITTQDYSFAPGEFRNKQAQSTFTPMMSPMNIYDVDLNTSGVQQGPLTQSQASERGAQGQELPTTNNETKRPIDYNSMFTLGLGLTSGFLNQREEQRNRRQLNESIQQRQSQPLYDYNYMYGRTTSGGTEFQPIVKAEMGAQINKRYDSPSSINNVEIEGGEYLQLPDMSTEMAYGPSHSRGGIETSLPEGTRVYSNHLKPMGSKKTFAQMAKKYDNSEYDKILNNKFAKQVDKDTAAIMRDKNQKVLDKLFMDQQMMNGNSNGELMAKNGASINNAGFRALPKAVQDQIISNMEYGGYSLPKLQGGDWYTSGQWDAAQGQGALTNLPRVTQNRITNPGFNTSAPQPRGLGYSMNASIAAQRPGSQTAPVQPTQQQNIPVTGLDANSLMSRPQGSGVINPFGQVNPLAAPESFPSTQSPQTAQPTQTTQPAQAKQSTAAKSSSQAVDMNSLPETLRKYAKWDAGKNKFRLDVPSGLSPQELSTIANEAESFGIGKLVQSGSNRLKGPASEYSGFYAGLTPQDFEKKIVLEELGEEGIQGLSEQELRKKAFDLMGVDYSNLDITDAKKLYNDPKFRENQLYTAFTKYLPQDQFRKELKDDFKLGFEHYDAIKGKAKPPSEPPAKPPTEPPTEPPGIVKTPGFTSVTGQGSGKYYRQPFPLEQAIPNVMGLAASQETFPYAIPEIDSPYIRPQTLNIQSQLQDIDNMGQAAVKGGADPLSAYIAGIGGKEKAFQSKQNFDAQGRMQADMFNAQAQQRTDMMNAQMFDRTYNNLIAQARDAATAEQQASIVNLIDKKAKYDQDENLKSLYLDNLQSAFEIGKDRPYSMTVDPQGRPTFSYGILPAQVDMPTKGRTTKTKKDETKTTDVVPSEKITTTRRTR